MPEILQKSPEERQSESPFKLGKLYVGRILAFGLSEYKGEINQFDLSIQTYKEFEVKDKDLGNIKKRLVIRHFKPSNYIPAPGQESQKFLNSKLDQLFKAVPTSKEAVQKCFQFSKNSAGWKVVTKEEVEKVAGIFLFNHEEETPAPDGMVCNFTGDGADVAFNIKFDNGGYAKVDNIYAVDEEQQAEIDKLKKASIPF